MTSRGQKLEFESLPNGNSQATSWIGATNPGGNPTANPKSISRRCHLREVASEWELTKEPIFLPLGCLQGGLGWVRDYHKAALDWLAREALDLRSGLGFRHQGVWFGALGSGFGFRI